MFLFKVLEAQPWSSGRLTLETHAGYTIRVIAEIKGGWQQGRIPIQANGPTTSNNGICWIKREEGRARG